MNLVSYAAALAGAVLALTACTATDTAAKPTSLAAQAANAAPSAAADTAPTREPSPTPPPPEPRVASSIRHGATVPVGTPLKVTGVDGTLTSVEVDGLWPIEGTLSDGTWTAQTPLSAGEKYRVRVTLNGPAGPKQRSFTFTTEPSTPKLSIDVTPNDNTTVGVAQPIALRFNVPVTAREDVVNAITVTTVPQTEGAWRWVSDRELRWRPKQYWQPGTQVTVSADLRGIEISDGVFARSPFTQSFTVGKSQVVKINAKTKMMKVYVNGKLTRSIPVSLGKPGWETRSGTKVILERYKVRRMTSAELGAEEFYDLQVPYAIRITWSGEFIHGAPWATSRLGRWNGSHGCTNVGMKDAKWLFTNLQAGDPVITTGTKRKMELANGYGDWNYSWEQWTTPQK